MTEFASDAEDAIQADPAAEANDETSSPAWAADRLAFARRLRPGDRRVSAGKPAHAAGRRSPHNRRRGRPGGDGNRDCRRHRCADNGHHHQAARSKDRDVGVDRHCWCCRTYLAASASGLTTLLLARVLLGVSLGGFWSMAAAMAMRLVPMRLMPRAMSIILTGVSIATVCAAPVGAYVGERLGMARGFHHRRNHRRGHACSLQMTHAAEAAADRLSRACAHCSSS